MSKNKSFVLITGASGGIGLELAREFARHGHNLVLVARGHERLKAIAGSLAVDYNVEVDAFEQDLAVPGSAEKVYNYVRKSDYIIVALVNNAGFGMGGRFALQDTTRLNQMMQLNMNTLTELTRLFVPDMVQRGSGRILNVASTAAFLPGPFMAVYYATKAYVLSFSRALAYELKPQGVTVTALCPGPTKTHFAQAAKVENNRLFRGRLLSAEQVAADAYAGLMGGKEVVMPGWRNKVSVAVIRWLPHNVLMRAVNAAQGDKGV